MLIIYRNIKVNLRNKSREDMDANQLNTRCNLSKKLVGICVREKSETTYDKRQMGQF